MDSASINRIIYKNEREGATPNLPLAATGVYHVVDPAVSQAQRGYLAEHFGPAWMAKHHFNNKGKLPAHVPKKGK